MQWHPWGFSMDLQVVGYLRTNTCPIIHLAIFWTKMSGNKELGTDHKPYSGHS